MDNKPTPSTNPVLPPVPPTQPTQAKEENKTLSVVILIGILILGLINIVGFVVLPIIINEMKTSAPTTVGTCVEPTLEVKTTQGVKIMKLGEAMELLATTLSAEHGKIYEVCGGEPIKQ